MGSPTTVLLSEGEELPSGEAPGASHGDHLVLKILCESGGGDLLFPESLLSGPSRLRSHPLRERRPYYLVLAHNPSRTLTDVAREMILALRRVCWNLGEEIPEARESETVSQKHLEC